MSAPQRVSNEQIRVAIERRGSIAAAAADLGISENALRKRIEALGLRIDRTRPRRPVRVSAEHEERIRQAKYDLQAKLRRDFDESEVLRWFLAESFERWLREKLAEPELPASSPADGSGAVVRGRR